MGRHSKSESDVENDAHVADLRAYQHGDGSYLGRAASEENFDAGRTGAETRSHEA
jgi:hypothetical protein